MLTDYEDDFFFEEDKIKDNSIEDVKIVCIESNDENGLVLQQANDDGNCGGDDADDIDKPDKNSDAIENDNETLGVEEEICDPVLYAGGYPEEDEHRCSYAYQRLEMDRFLQQANDDGNCGGDDADDIDKPDKNSDAIENDNETLGVEEEICDPVLYAGGYPEEDEHRCSYAYQRLEMDRFLQQANDDGNCGGDDADDIDKPDKNSDAIENDNETLGVEEEICDPVLYAGGYPEEDEHRCSYAYQRLEMDRFLQQANDDGNCGGDDADDIDKPDKNSDAIENDNETLGVEEEICDPVLYAGGYPEEDEHRCSYAYQRLEMDRLGMTVTSGSVLIKKDQTNLIGISIGGGAPLCPCLYIVQVFDGTPAAREGSLQSGDELLGVNGQSVKGKTKVEVAKMIQAATEEVTVHYNKLHADPTQGESLDIVLKKIKHRLVEAMSSSTADTLGLSRAILCNDSLVKRLQELQATEQMYKGLVEHAKRMLKAYFDLLQTFQAFGNVFAAISVREPQPRASEAFRLFSELHRNMEKDGVKMLKSIKPVLIDLGTYLNKAIPDTKMTIRRYADAKFTYLSYCLKVKEMDDEEHSYAALQEPLYRVETGNYEYRLILRCRQEARSKFAKLRNDVLEKMELLESKHARDLAIQLKRFIEGLATLGTETVSRLKELPNLFPIEVDLKESAFQYKMNMTFNTDEDITSEELMCGEEATEITTTMKNNDSDNMKVDNLIAGFEEINLTSSPAEGDALLAELGLADIDLSAGNSVNYNNFSKDLLQ